VDCGSVCNLLYNPLVLKYTFIPSLCYLLLDSSDEVVTNILKEEWEQDLRKILVEVGIELWEGEDYIR
jgi:hypothetical protein